MPQWLIDYIANQTPGSWEELHWSTKRRMAIQWRWPDSRVRAAEQDARNFLPDDLAMYDIEVAEIKLAIPKP